MNVTIREGRPEDADVICEFNRLMALETENKHLDPAILKPGVDAMFDNDWATYYVAEGEKGEIVGQLGITLEWSDWRNGNFWWIQSVYVRKDARRHGVFRKLYEHVIAAAKYEDNVVGVRLYVEHDNKIAQETYRKMGMAMTGYVVMEDLF